ncbi:MAG: hypothetical protein O7D91_06785 [Planctomycetota bacterium]|nr:hypothetical protein [Planctomycetota bacterium]
MIRETLGSMRFPSRFKDLSGLAVARSVAVFMLCLSVSLLAAMGCQETRTTGFRRPLPPKPRPIQRVQPNARADALVLNVSAGPLDTNGNGYPDLIHATAHLFDTRYPPAMREDGAFVFLLFVSGEVGRANAQPIRQWRIEGAELQRAQTRSAFGESYQFKLSLLADGTDTLPIAAADMVCRFEPADGRDPVYAGQISSIQLGRRVLIPQPAWRQRTEPPAAPAAHEGE